MRARDYLRVAAVAFGRECPECGAREGIEDNGARGEHLTYGCHGGNGCGHQWGAAEWRAKLPDEP